MMSFEERGKFFFAARRHRNIDTTTALILVAPKTLDVYYANERMLTEKGVALGQFVFAKAINGQLLVSSIRKTEHKKKMVVKIEGDVAYIENIPGFVIPARGKLGFKSEDFAIALVKDELFRGEYTARISLMEHAHVVSDDFKFLFEASRLVPSNNEEDVIVGQGFAEPEIPSHPTLRAVVLTVSEKNGTRMHFLWVLEKQTEGLLVDSAHPCERGHCFEGTFKEKNGKWTCAKYGGQVTTANGEPLIQGGIEDNRIFFKVQLTGFRKASVNERYDQAKAEYFEEILDNEFKLSDDCVGSYVKIQRRTIGDKEFAWVVFEVL